MSDQSEFLRLYLAHQSEIRAFVRALVPDRQNYEDVCQDIATVLWKKFDTYDPTRRFGAWARGVAVFEIKSFRNKSRRHPIPFSIETIEAIQSEFDRREPRTASSMLEFVERCLRRLTDRACHIFRLRYQRDLSVPEIAQEVNGTPIAIYKTLARSREAVRQCVQQQVTGDEVLAQ